MFEFTFKILIHVCLTAKVIVDFFKPFIPFFISFQCFPPEIPQVNFHKLNNLEFLANVQLLNRNIINIIIVTQFIQHILMFVFFIFWIIPLNTSINPPIDLIFIITYITLNILFKIITHI